jgi:hypothetical protein
MRPTLDQATKQQARFSPDANDGAARRADELGGTGRWRGRCLTALREVGRRCPQGARGRAYYGDVRLPDPSLDLDPKTHVINPHGLASSSWTGR